jgi:hypothetical protein
MSRRHVPHLTLVTVAILTLGALALSVHDDVAANVAASTRHGGSKTNPYGGASYGFGGYTVYRFTSEIGAEWRVPAINTHSSDGDASTWIGVEDEHRQFIQLGTTENKVNGVSRYGVFWSDVTVNFNPQQLLNVVPGDLIKFTMRQTYGGWRLSFDDVTDATPETITVPYARGATFDLGQWIQEDPTEGGLTQHLAYPSMAAPTFSHLSLDSAAPTIREDYGQVLSTASGVHLVPTAVARNQFTFHGATGAARQYLDDVFPYDEALYPLQVDLFDNRAPNTTTVQRLSSTLSTLRNQLMTQTWPTALRPAIKADANEMSGYLQLYDRFATSPQRQSIKYWARDKVLNVPFTRLSVRIHQLLGLPPPR